MPNLLHSLHNARDYADTNTTDIANSSANSGDKPSKALIAAWVMVVAISFIFALTSLFTYLNDRNARAKEAIDSRRCGGAGGCHYRPAHGVFGQAEHSQLVYDDSESAVEASAHGQQSCERLPTMPPAAHRSFC